MITAIILTFFIGTLTGYIVAALMAVSSNADRAREEQEKATEQPPVFKCEEKKLIPLIAVQEIPLDDISPYPNDIMQKVITNSLMGQFNDEIRQRVVWDIDPYRRKHIVKLRIWVDTET
jgi:hypothetical protein